MKPRTPGHGPSQEAPGPVSASLEKARARKGRRKPFEQDAEEVPEMRTARGDGRGRVGGSTSYGPGGGARTRPFGRVGPRTNAVPVVSAGPVGRREACASANQTLAVRGGGEPAYAGGPDGTQRVVTVNSTTSARGRRGGDACDVHNDGVPLRTPSRRARSAAHAAENCRASECSSPSKAGRTELPVDEKLSRRGRGNAPTGKGRSRRPPVAPRDGPDGRTRRQREKHYRRVGAPRARQSRGTAGIRGGDLDPLGSAPL